MCAGAWVLAGAALAAPAAADPAADRQLEGYALAVLEHVVRAPGCGVRAEHGVLAVACTPHLTAAQRAALADAMAGAAGYAGLAPQGPMAPETPRDGAPAASAPPAPARAQTAWFPRESLFDAPIADPREPRFFVAARHYDTDVAAGWFTEVGYGENFPIYRRGAWQAGISGGLFALFDLEAESFDLINADYTVGVPVTWRHGARSARVRLYHQSSHLGDEFLLRAQPERVNLSFEALEVLLARRIGDVRVYGGGEALVHREPSDLDRFMVHVGAEYLPQIHTPVLAGLAGRPVAALDVKAWQEHDWSADLSLKAGWQFEAGDSGRLVRLLLEAFRGHAPHGQFYADRIDYLGLGIMFGL
jgi:hypothetical protein